jgi:DNA-binding MarR family transcriptional regulator
MRKIAIEEGSLVVGRRFCFGVGLRHCGYLRGKDMRQSDDLGGRTIDLRILRALEEVGPRPVTAYELAGALATSAHSVAPALQALVKAGLARRHWGDAGSARTYAVTATGREYLAVQESEVHSRS